MGIVAVKIGLPDMQTLCLFFLTQSKVLSNTSSLKTNIPRLVSLAIHYVFQDMAQCQVALISWQQTMLLQSNFLFISVHLPCLRL